MSAYQRELAELENLRGLRIDDMEQENWSALIAIPESRLHVLPAEEPRITIWVRIRAWLIEWCIP